MFGKVENFSWKFMKYQGPTDDLIISDYSKMQNDPEPQDNPKGEHLALILDFVLPSSTYATMALRELMKSDTSVGNQINLEKEIKKSADDEMTKKRPVEDDVKDDDETKKIKIE